ncbi:Asp-tRNA(Asn)/Glu-tRNA(Gln) amidotransferase subunit GatB [bacterium]|jgi:aspartyl-tRNA(Asn)/glutamyl-tRNA(Gln) amidotransferase subunit B|nr:Asp-tRNA(Asn)/Glu-tRNA(Gln) amidotransferase subunit GatB [bacterium]
MEYEIVIGLEVHVQLNTLSKMFCGCSTKFGAEPNTQTCPVCLGLPGVLPVMNEEAIRLTVKTGLAFGCKVSNFCKFDRKNYYYPDLPKNYQISQYDKPLNVGGSVPIRIKGEKKAIKLTRIHLEEDAGKLVHNICGGSGVDLNRTGLPLMEIVSEPDIQSPDEAYAYLVSLKQGLKYLGVSDCNMEEGSLRCDANISIRPKGVLQLGTKTEIKNLNSFANVKKSLEYEAKRQEKALGGGERIIQETRLWDAVNNKTVSMRSKEEAHDYRYFPEPDLVPVVLDDEYFRKVAGEIPEMPDIRYERFIAEYKLSEYDAGVMTSDRDLADFFEETSKQGVDPKKVANWIMGDFLKEINTAKVGICDVKVKSPDLASLIKLIDEGTISGKIAKDVFAEMFVSGKKPETVIREKGLIQISDEKSIEGVIESVLKSNSKVVDDYKSGKKSAAGFMVGLIMKASKGKANPKLVNELLKKKLSGL